MNALDRLLPRAVHEKLARDKRGVFVTAYLPITLEAYELTKKSGFYEKNPGTDVSVKQMIVKTTDKSRGIRLGNFVQIRDIIDEELENVWGGKKTAKEGLHAAVARGNEQIAKFAKTAGQ
jgi:sn-glycerol 3-phosphate transport system substrate-binding protein